MDFVEEYLKSIEDSFLLDDERVRFFLQKVNSIIYEINKNVEPYTYDEYCIGVYEESKAFAIEFNENTSLQKMECVDWNLTLFDACVRLRVNQKVGTNGFDYWFDASGNPKNFNNYVDYFNEEYF